MPNDLERRLHVIATTFVREILEAIGESTLEDVLDQARPTARAEREPRPARAATSPAPAAASPMVASSPRAAPKRGPGRPRKDGGTASDSAEALTRIVRHVSSNPGSTGELARKALGLSRSTWNLALRKAIAEGHLRKQGEKRGTKYWAASAKG